MSCRIAFSPSKWRSTTSPSPSTWPPLRTSSALPSVNPPLLRKRQLYSRQKLRNKNFKRHLKREDKSKICVFDNSKSDWQMFQVKSAYHLEDITECSKFPRFLFQIFLIFILNTLKTWVLLKSTSHLDRERFLSHQLF